MIHTHLKVMNIIEKNITYKNPSEKAISLSELKLPSDQIKPIQTYHNMMIILSNGIIPNLTCKAFT